MKKIVLIILLLPVVIQAQDNNYGVKGFYPKTFSLTDSSPISYNGLTAAYTIKEETEKSVGKKGDFSRYKIFFSLTNTSTEAKIMYRNLSFAGHSGPINNNIALFKCLNATGARMTNKMASMELQPCKLEAQVEGNKVLADIGYWIRPGETVSKTYPMIFPLGEKPVVSVTFYPEVGNQTGTMFTGNEENVPQNYQAEFVRIKNVSTGSYLQNESGPLACTTIDFEWWSAQWEIVPANGNSNFQIKNRWKNNFISVDNNDLLTDNSSSPGSFWKIEETGTANVFYIRNVQNNSKLLFQNGQLRTSNSYSSNDTMAQWIIEK